MCARLLLNSIRSLDDCWRYVITPTHGFLLYFGWVFLRRTTSTQLKRPSLGGMRGVEFAFQRFFFSPLKYHVTSLIPQLRRSNNFNGFDYRRGGRASYVSIDFLRCFLVWLSWFFLCISCSKHAVVCLMCLFTLLRVEVGEIHVSFLLRHNTSICRLLGDI